MAARRAWQRDFDGSLAAQRQVNEEKPERGVISGHCYRAATDACTLMQTNEGFKTLWNQLCVEALAELSVGCVPDYLWTADSIHPDYLCTADSIHPAPHPVIEALNPLSMALEDVEDGLLRVDPAVVSLLPRPCFNVPMTLRTKVFDEAIDLLSFRLGLPPLEEMYQDNLSDHGLVVSKVIGRHLITQPSVVSST